MDIRESHCKICEYGTKAYDSKDYFCWYKMNKYIDVNFNEYCKDYKEDWIKVIKYGKIKRFLKDKER